METPNYSDIVQECATIEQYITDDVSMQAHINYALAEVKRYLRNMRGVEWSTVYDVANEEYFKDTDDNENNKDNILKAIRLMTIALIYKANAQEARESIWWDLYKEYLIEANTLMDNAKLDIDFNKSGEIEDAEEEYSGQVFFRL